MGEQLDTAKLGLWLFLASELLFFGGLFVAYAVYRANHPDALPLRPPLPRLAHGRRSTPLVLVGSSLSAAWSVRSAQLGQQARAAAHRCSLTLLLAGVFLVVKYFEYSHKLHNGDLLGRRLPPQRGDPGRAAGRRCGPRRCPANLGTFFSIYFLMTGLHGIHVLIGMGLYVWLIRRAGRGDFGPGYYVPVDAVALYWHLVDMIWIFLFPLFYLI